MMQSVPRPQKLSECKAKGLGQTISDQQSWVFSFCNGHSTVSALASCSDEQFRLCFNDLNRVNAGHQTFCSILEVGNRVMV